MAGLYFSTTTYAGQVKPTPSSSNQSSGPQAEKILHAAKELPSCTPEKSTRGDARPSSHSVTLSWKASTSPGVMGYNVYRRDKTSRPGKINQKPIAGTSCIDYFVELRHKYYYYVVAADHLGAREGGRSNTVPAKIPRK
jgi:hypothetical protein